jgi:hypothetical protein
MGTATFITCAICLEGLAESIAYAALREIGECHEKLPTRPVDNFVDKTSSIHAKRGGHSLWKYCLIFEQSILFINNNGLQKFMVYKPIIKKNIPQSS